MVNSSWEEILAAPTRKAGHLITNSPQHAIKGYAVCALDYILKPLSYYASASG